MPQKASYCAHKTQNRKAKYKMNSLNMTDLHRIQIQLNNPLLKPLDAYNIRAMLQCKNGLLASQRGIDNTLGLLSSPSMLPGTSADTMQLLALANKNPIYSSVIPSNTLNQMALLSKLNTTTPFVTNKRGGAGTAGRVEPFPEKLHRLLFEVEAIGRSAVISFIADDIFRIHDPVAFFRDVVPQYFRQSKLTSFKRQLKLYGFELISYGPYKGGYRHNMFSKKSAEKCREMRRVAIKTPKSSQAKESTSSSIQASKNESESSSNELTAPAAVFT
jgi:hypothetical protein